MTENNHTCSLTREEFLDSFVQLYHAVKDYEELLDLFADESRPDPQLITKALKERIAKLQFDGANSKSMEMIGAYIRFTLESFKGEKLHFAIPDAPGDEFFLENTGLVPLADSIQQAEQGLAEVQDKVFYLTRLLPPKNTERIRLLLKAVASLFKAIIRRDFGDLENHVSHIHHLTANKESFFLVNEIGRMVRDIHNSLEDLSSTVPTDQLDQTVMDEMPDAIDKLNLVILRMETAANSTLDQAEELLDRNAERQSNNHVILDACADIKNRLTVVQNLHPDTASEVAKMMEILNQQVIPAVEAHGEELKKDESVYFEIIGSQSFQDITGQTLKKIITFIEQLELSLLNILQKYSNQLPKVATAPAAGPAHVSPLVGKETADGIVLEGPKDNKAGRSTGHATNQSDIDKMLADFGF